MTPHSLPSYSTRRAFWAPRNDGNGFEHAWIQVADYLRRISLALETFMDSSQSNTNQEWRGLCELALSEYDPEKFRAIVTQPNRLLDERDERRRRDREK